MQTKTPWNITELIRRRRFQGQHHLQRALEQTRQLKPPGAIVCWIMVNTN
jgi:hypothetical protein